MSFKSNWYNFMEVWDTAPATPLDIANPTHHFLTEPTLNFCLLQHIITFFTYMFSVFSCFSYCREALSKLCKFWRLWDQLVEYVVPPPFCKPKVHPSVSLAFCINILQVTNVLFDVFVYNYEACVTRSWVIK